jgi:hypothetical protein
VAIAKITANSTPAIQRTGHSVTHERRFLAVSYSRYIKMSHSSYSMNDERERLLDKLDAETDATTRAEAIDTAIRQYLEDKSNREEHWEEFTTEQPRLLNTSELKVSYYPKVR